MKKLFLVIISFFFANNVYATNLEYTTTQYYSLTENERQHCRPDSAQYQKIQRCILCLLTYMQPDFFRQV